ncbi:unnamed protein product [Schistosoma margrebowiei]|uniref:Uncharacterized protein n=1 Tax=Schistosoma margrebowiei TaxID=48269 RepID=A0A183M7J0_9TREM|nr:unnamed protein product [Schistosoma margrebowiei]
MVVGGNQQETLDPGFVLLGTRQQEKNIVKQVETITTQIDYLTSKNLKDDPLNNDQIIQDSFTRSQI